MAIPVRQVKIVEIARSMIFKLYRTNSRNLIFYLSCVVDVRRAPVRKRYIDQNRC